MQDLDKILAAWAAPLPRVGALTLFGSRARAGADAASDWDFQVITSRPALFGDAQWIRSLPGVEVRLYAPRTTRFGGVPKVNMVLAGAEADLVVLPEGPLRVAKVLVALGLHRREGALRRRLRDLAVAVRPGWRFLKGERRWGAFYARVVAEVDDPRLSDREVRQMGDVFAYDYLWTLRKLGRGELVAAQRMLQRELSETNLRLVHELRQRAGEPSCPEGRRAELLMGADAVRFAVGCRGDAGELAAEAARCRDVLRGLMESLVGGTWRWPDGLP